MEEENIILSRQKKANVARIFSICSIIMLPVLSFGFDGAFMTTAMPKYLKANPTGIVLDLYQVSWIGGSIYHHLEFYQISK